jgi:hypothetical protein
MAFTPTQLGGGPSVRYGYKFNRTTLWIATIASGTYTPTEAEINHANSRDLTPGIQAYNGFSVSPRYAELQDIRSQVDGKVPDGSSLDDSSLVMYQASDDNDALDFFTAGDDGFIVDCPRGLFGSARAYAWKVEVSAVTPSVAISGGAVGTVAFGVLDMKVITLPTPT